MIRLRSSSFGATGCRLRRCAASARQALWCVSAAVFATIGGRASVFACSVCFEAEETSMIDGTKLGILALLAVTLTVQGAFLGFFLHLRTRAKRSAEMELETEWSELQRGASRTS
jgi:hypothetical protein